MKIDGKCHCGAVRIELQWPGTLADMTVRVCTCTFCRKHGGHWTSHRQAELLVVVSEPALLSRYRFGTQTADFHVCSRCGVVPFATSRIAQCTYAVVNVNSLEGSEVAALPRAPVSFDGEGAGDRLERRQRNWIANVHFSAS